jgi:hypothetical protein
MPWKLVKITTFDACYIFKKVSWRLASCLCFFSLLLRQTVAAPFLTSRPAIKVQTQLISLIVGSATGLICRAIKLLCKRKRAVLPQKQASKKLGEELCML